MMQIGAKAANVYPDWIRLGTQLLYTAIAPKFSARCQTVNARLFAGAG